MKKITFGIILFFLSANFLSQTSSSYDKTIINQLLDFDQYLIVDDTFSNYKKIQVELLNGIDLNTKNIDLVNSKVYSLRAILNDKMGIEKYLKKSKKNPDKWKPSYRVYELDENARKIDTLNYSLKGKSNEEAIKQMKNRFLDTTKSPMLFTGNDGGAIDDVILNFESGKYYACRKSSSHGLLSSLSLGTFFESINSSIEKGKYEVVDGIFNFEKYIYQGGLGNPDRMAYKCKILEKDQVSIGYMLFFKDSKMTIVVKDNDLGELKKAKNYALIRQNQLEIKRAQQSKKLNMLFSEWQKIFPDSSFFVFYEPWKMTGFQEFSNNLTYGELIISNNSKFVDSIYSIKDTLFKNRDFSLYPQKPILIGKYNLIDILTKPVKIGEMYCFSGADIYNSSSNDTLKKVEENVYKLLTRKYINNYDKTSEMRSKDYTAITNQGKFNKWRIDLEADIDCRKLSTKTLSDGTKSYGQKGSISIKISGGSIEDLRFNSEIKVSGYNEENEFYFQDVKKDKRFDMSSLNFYFAQKFQRKDDIFYSAGTSSSASPPNVYNTKNLLMSIEESKEFYSLWQHNDFLGELKEKIGNKEEREEEEKAKRLLIKKYGSKYVNAYFDYKIIVGMPEELAKNLLGNLYKVTSNSQSRYGDSYYAHSMFNSAQKIHVAFRNKRVSYVSHYSN